MLKKSRETITATTTPATESVTDVTLLTLHKIIVLIPKHVVKLDINEVSHSTTWNELLQLWIIFLGVLGTKWFGSSTICFVVHRCLFPSFFSLCRPRTQAFENQGFLACHWPLKLQSLWFRITLTLLSQLCLTLLRPHILW
jgi:hypothetical protein